MTSNFTPSPPRQKQQQQPASVAVEVLPAINQHKHQQQQQSSPRTGSRSPHRSRALVPAATAAGSPPRGSNPERDAAVIEQMSLSAWPSSKAGKTSEFASVLERFIDENLHRIDGDARDLLAAAQASAPGVGEAPSSIDQSSPNRRTPSNFSAVARCDILSKCLNAFAHHFTTYFSIFRKLQQSVDVISGAFDEQHRVNLDVDKFRSLCVAREQTLRQQLVSVIQKHEEEYRSEEELKRRVRELEAQLTAIKAELDATFRSLVRTQESLKETDERNDELSRSHVILTLRESKLRETVEGLERSVDVSHSHAEAKAREVGELRQEMATLRGAVHHVEAQLHHSEAQLQTANQTLQRKSRELEEREMECARLRVALRGGAAGGGGSGGGGEYDVLSRAQVAERVSEAVAAKEAELREMQRASTPRPDWSELAEKHGLSDMVKLGSFAVSVSSVSTPGSSPKLLRQSTRRWCELLAGALAKANKRCDEMAEAEQAAKDKADSLALELNLAQQRNAYHKAAGAAVGAGGGGGAKRGAVAGGAAAAGPGGKRAGAGGPKKPGASAAAAAGDFSFHAIQNAPDWLGRTGGTVLTVRGRNWALPEVLLHLSAATDFIIAHLNDPASAAVAAAAPASSTTALASSLSNSSGGGGGVNLDASLPLSGGRSGIFDHSALGGGGGGGLRKRGSMTETQMLLAYLERTRGNPFADAFHSWLVTTFHDVGVRREISYNLIFATRTRYAADIWCRMFVLALGGDCPVDVHTRTRQLIASFKRSFEMADSRSCGYAPKKSLAALIKTLMALYSQTEIKLVSQHLDGLPHMSTKSETLVDYRPLFSAGYDQPTEFMTLLATLSFRAMCTDINAAVNAVRAAATPSAAAPAAGAESGDISIGALLTALQSCDPRRELDLCKEYVSRLLGQASIKAVRVPVEALIARMRKTFLPRASPFPADLHFVYPTPSVVEVMRTDEEPPVKPEEAKK